MTLSDLERDKMLNGREMKGDGQVAKKKARERIGGKKLKEQGGIEVQQPAKPSASGDISPAGSGGGGQGEIELNLFSF